METIIMYVFKKYGLKLSIAEAEGLIRWFEVNKGKLLTENDVDREVSEYLFETYKNRPRFIMDEDLSHMKYLLSLLKEQTKKN